jgi:hypothetical protein
MASTGCQNTPTDRSVADAYDIGFGAGQEDRRRGQGRPMDIPPSESRPEAEAATFNARLPMHMKKCFSAPPTFAIRRLPSSYSAQLTIAP